MAGVRGRLVLCRVGEQFAELLRVTRLTSQFEIQPRLRDVLGVDSPRRERRRREPALAGVGGGEPDWID